MRNRKNLVWVVLALMSLALVLWLVAVRDFNTIASYLGAGYMLLNIVFLVIQFVAFVGAHTGYDKNVENVKMELLRLEKEEWA